MGLGAALVSMGWLAPRDADACGGTFCDTGPQVMLVEQTAENVLFVMDGNRVEAHIQILYDPETEAQQFAWVVPLTAIPDFAVGSDPLFEELLANSAPALSLTTTNSCEPDDGGDKFDIGGGGSFIAEPDSMPPPPPEILKEQTVGAFDITVLEGVSASGVMSWLAQNGYAQPNQALPILAEYIEEGFLFAAFKLTNNADVSDIHPVVLSYEGMEPCVPLRLTQIAAADDMEVRVFFLGDGRVVPGNYAHVELNDLMLDWFDPDDAYKDLVTLAVDGPGADGHGFVTEYAGDSGVANAAAVLGPDWDESVFASAEAKDVTTLLEAQGLASCVQDLGCKFFHPLVLPLLRQYVPVPAGMDEQEFYGCLTCNETDIDPMAWDPAAFAQDFRERILDPGLHAADLLMTWPHLTRLYTTISPQEMTVDPLFHGAPELPDVPRARTAEHRLLCDLDAAIVTTPDGRETYLPWRILWAEFEDGMPHAERVERMTPNAAPMVVQDNTEEIDLRLLEYNCGFDWPSAEACEGSGGTDDGTGDTGGSGVGPSDGGGDTDTGGASGAGATSERGCSCANGTARDVPALLPLLLLAGVHRRARPR